MQNIKVKRGVEAGGDVGPHNEAVRKKGCGKRTCHVADQKRAKDGGDAASQGREEGDGDIVVAFQGKIKVIHEFVADVKGARKRHGRESSCVEASGI